MSSANETISTRLSSETYPTTEAALKSLPEDVWCVGCGWDGLEDELMFTNEGVFVCPQCGGEDTDYFYSEDSSSCVFCGSDKVVGVIDIVSLNEIHEATPLDKEQVYGYCARCADVKMAEGSTGDQIVSWEDGAGVSSPSMPPSDIKWAESKKERIASGRAMHYAIPSEKKYPIWDKAHGRMALAWSKGTKYADRVEKAVTKRFPTMNAETVYRNYPGRKGPSLSATSVKRGTRKRGNDGKMWEVRRSGKSQRWFRGAESFDVDVDGECYNCGGRGYYANATKSMVERIKDYMDEIVISDEEKNALICNECFEESITAARSYWSAESFAATGEPDAPYDQGYDDQQDESLGERNVTTGEQSLKDRRDEADAMDKKPRFKCTAYSHRDYSSSDSWNSPIKLSKDLGTSDWCTSTDKDGKEHGNQFTLKYRGRKYHDVGTMDKGKVCAKCGTYGYWGDTSGSEGGVGSGSGKYCPVCSGMVPGIDMGAIKKEAARHRANRAKKNLSGAGKITDVDTGSKTITARAENMGLTQYVGSAGGSGDGTPVSYGGIALPESDVAAMVESSTDNPMGASIGTVMGTMGAEDELESVWTILIDDNDSYSETFVFNSKKNASKFRQAAMNSEYLQDNDMGVYNVVEQQVINEELSDSDTANWLSIDCLKCGDDCGCDDEESGSTDTPETRRRNEEKWRSKSFPEFNPSPAEMKVLQKNWDAKAARLGMGAEEVPVVPDPSSFPQGDGRVLGQQTNQANLSPLHAEGEDVQKVKIQDPVMTGAKMALGVVALNATAIAGAALIGLAISYTARREV